MVTNKQITTHYNTECYDAFGNAKGFLSGLNLRDTKTGETSKLAVKGMFYGIGHSPNSGRGRASSWRSRACGRRRRGGRSAFAR